MTNYGEAGWATRAKKRRTVRDKVRKKFEADLSLSPKHSADDLKFSPQAQRLIVTRLMQVTRDGAMGAEHKEMLTLLAQSIAATGLGVGQMAGTSRHIKSVHKNHTRYLDKFFLHQYKFEGSRR